MKNKEGGIRVKQLYGITIPLVTPFLQNGQVYYEGLAQLTDMLIEKGVDCLYPCGTTGEMLRLSLEERMKVAETVIKTAGGRATTFVHCGCMNQEDTVTLLQHARAAGADGAGVVTPVFFRQNNRELEEYFVAVAGSVSDFPVYLYNIPQCASNDLPVETVKRIRQRSANVVGLKYSWPDINRTIDYINIGDGFSVLHGCDRAMISMLAAGCRGTVSGVAGVFPEPFIAAYKAYQEKRLEEAMRLQKVCVRFVDALKGGCNMSYFKEGLKLRGIDAGHMRRPQLDIQDSKKEKLKAELEEICSDAGIEMEVS